MDSKDLTPDLYFMTQTDRPSGKPHSKMESFNGPWLFDDSGRYAASVQTNQKSEILTIVVYDGLVKETFNYMCDYTPISFKWFYWYGGRLVLVVGNSLETQPMIFYFELNHDQKNVRLILIRANPVKLPICSKFEGPSIPLRLVSLDGIAGPYRLSLVPLSCEGKLYLLKNRRWGNSVAFRLDSLIQIDLSKLENINDKTVDYDEVIARQDRSAYSDVSFVSESRAKAGGKIPFLGNPKIIQTKPDNAFLYLFDTNKRCTGAIAIDLKQKKLVKFDTEIIEEQKFLETCHISGQIVRISYGGKKQQKMFCKNVLRIPQYTVPTLKNLAKQKLLQGIKPFITSDRKAVEGIL